MDAHRAPRWPRSSTTSSTRPEAVRPPARSAELLARPPRPRGGRDVPGHGAGVHRRSRSTTLEDELFKATPKRLIAFELPFAFDGLPAEQVAETLAELPAVIRVLHRWFWQPAYDRLVAPLAAVG